MTERDAFLRAICAAPADDTPRLVYSDWLEERGDRPDDPARAEFIRVQIDIARLNPPKVVEPLGMEMDGMGMLEMPDPVGGTYQLQHYQPDPRETQRASVWVAEHNWIKPGDIIDLRSGGYQLSGCVVLEIRRIFATAGEPPPGPIELRVKRSILDPYQHRKELARLRERELALYREHYGVWFDAHHPGIQWPMILPNEVDPRVFRGFVGAVHCPAEVWFDHYAEFTARYPVQLVRFPDPFATGQDATDVWLPGFSRVSKAYHPEPGNSAAAFLLRHHWPRIAFSTPVEHNPWRLEIPARDS